MKKIGISSKEKEEYLRIELNEKSMLIYEYLIDIHPISNIHEGIKDWDSASEEMLNIMMTIINSGSRFKLQIISFSIIYVLAKRGYDLSKVNNDINNYRSFEKNISYSILRGYAGLVLAKSRRKVAEDNRN